MKEEELRQLLRAVKSGEVNIEDAARQIRVAPFVDIGYAKVDTHRELSQGVAEVIYGAGKTAEQIGGIARAMLDAGQKTVLITRMSRRKASALPPELPLTYYPDARIGIVGPMPEPVGDGRIVVVTAGTSDLRVAEEAALTAEVLGNRVERLYDAGVAGIHRLLAHLDLLMCANVVIVVAGMEGALASVTGGLVQCPVIAVPTSVGYGVAKGGKAALLSMLSSCASGVSVVNIDNGYGAGYLASLINQRTQRVSRQPEERQL